MGTGPNSRGRMWPERWVDCGLCETREQLAAATYARAMKEAEHLGWRRVPEHGWVCPRDMAELQKRVARWDLLPAREQNSRRAHQ
jgi:hypothetical protein